MKTANRFHLAVGVVMLLLGAATVAAEDPTPTPTPTPAPTSLSEYAGNITLNQEADGTPAEDAIVITNTTVDPDATGEQAKKAPAKPSGVTVDDPTIPMLKELAKEPEGAEAERAKRDKWVALYRDQLRLIADLKAEIAALDIEIPGLVNKFYSWDDPHYRDGVIKPQLDAAMKRREEARQELAAAEVELPKILDRARRDGALPGWFRGVTADSPAPTPPPESPPAESP
jgi:hypothetical protein